MSKNPKKFDVETHKWVLESILGHPGGICSFSKSMGPAMAVYNSKLILGCDGKSQEIWHGDIVLSSIIRRILERYATDHNIVLTVNYESGGKVWCTKTPEILDNMPVLEAEEVRIRRSEERIRDRLSGMGILTPIGTAWTWYNTWFYKGPYAVYAYLRSFGHAFIWYPINFAIMSDGYDGGNRTFWGKIRLAFKIFLKECHYQRYEGGFFHFGCFKLYNK